MKIVIATGIYPPEIGGPATFVRALARTLRKTKEVDFVVVTYGDRLTEAGEGWKVTPVVRAGGPLVRYARYAWRVFREALHADIVFVQGAVSEGFPGTIGALLARKKIVMRVPGDYAWEQYNQQTPESPKEFLEEFVTRRHYGRIYIMQVIERWTARRAARIIVPSQYVKRIVTAWGVDPTRIRVIYSSTTPFPQAPERDEVRQALGCEGKTLIFTVARLVPWKCVDFLIDVLVDLPDSSMLVVAGDGPLLSELRAFAEARGVSHRCRFLGRVDHGMVGQWFVAADVFVLASAYEGFPHVVVEAITRGLPCLVSDKGGNPETKELFPDHVRVLPYRERQAWVNALRESHPRLAEIPPRDFSAVSGDIVSVIREVCAS